MQQLHLHMLEWSTCVLVVLTCVIPDITLGTAHNEFGYYKHPALMNRFLSQKRRLLIDTNV